MNQQKLLERPPMMDWNVIATTHSDGFSDAIRILSRFGRVDRTDYFNVLILQVADIRGFLRAFSETVEREPGVLNFVSHLTPAEKTLSFQTPEEFEDKASQTALQWVPALAGRTFHVRMSRRGFKGKLSSPDEERFVDGALMKALAEAGTPGRITFDDPDAIISVDTLNNRAGLSLWTRDDLQRYDFLGVD